MTGIVEGVAEATKALLRLEGTGEDALLARLARAAWELAEAYCGRALAAEWEGLPAPVAHGVVLLAAHLFENRGRDEEPPAAVTALWRPYRAMRL